MRLRDAGETDYFVRGRGGRPRSAGAVLLVLEAQAAGDGLPLLQAQGQIYPHEGGV